MHGRAAAILFVMKIIGNMVRLMHGTLFQYKSSPSLVAFESSPAAVASFRPPAAINKLILIGGLSDGLMPTPYTEQLELACHALGWSLVQPIISSSYLGFGTGSLLRDTMELSELMKCLVENRFAKNLAIVGHSTGCQNAVHVMKFGDEEIKNLVKCIVLQAPVSDRESASLNDNYPDAHNSYIQLAQQFVVGKKGNEMMPRDAHWAPITAYRYLSLYDVNGDDDFFSSDLTDEELVEKLSHLSTYQQSGLHTLVTYSGSDEYVPSNVNKEELVERLCMAMNAKCSKGSRQVASPLLLPSGNHNLSQSPSDASTFVDAVSAHLQLAVPP